MSASDTSLAHFLEAQNARGAGARVVEAALRELAAGRKTSHWMWFVLPQLRGLGVSSTAQFYGIAGAEEARAYLAHAELGARLRQCVTAVLAHRKKSAERIFGPVDAMPNMTDTMPSLDYEDLFRHLPVAAIVAKERIMVDCNDRALHLFRATRDDIIDQSFAKLYPEQKDFATTGHRLAPLLAKHAGFSDDRIMRRIDGSHFWVTVCGFGYNPKRPFELAIWTFTDLSGGTKHPDVTSTLTERERDVAAFLVHGLTSKEIGKELNISPRTVDIHRASLLRKYEVRTTHDLIARLLA